MIRFEQLSIKDSRPLFKAAYKKNESLAQKKLSVIAAEAFKDYRKAKNTPGIFIEMGTWFQGFRVTVEKAYDWALGRERTTREVTRCEVCMAGSVLLAHGVPPGAMVGGQIKVDSLMMAVDCLRRGSVESAARRLGRSDRFIERLRNADCHHFYFDSGHHGNKSWERAFQKMIRTLRRKGF